MWTPFLKARYNESAQAPHSPHAIQPFSIPSCLHYKFPTCSDLAHGFIRDKLGDVRRSSPADAECRHKHVEISLGQDALRQQTMSLVASGWLALGPRCGGSSLNKGELGESGAVPLDPSSPGWKRSGGTARKFFTFRREIGRQVASGLFSGFGHVSPVPIRQRTLPLFECSSGICRP